LDTYAPPSSSDLSPVIIFIYGGAWISGDKHLYALLGRHLAAEGYLVVIPNYTLFPKAQVNTMIEEVSQAITWTEKNCAALGGDPERIFVCGHSAGAHLALLTAIRDHTNISGSCSLKIKGLIGFFLFLFLFLC